MYPRVNLAMHDSGLLYKRFLHTSPMSIADSIASTRTVQQRTIFCVEFQCHHNEALTLHMASNFTL